jgi:hypothetical protein
VSKPTMTLSSWWGDESFFRDRDHVLNVKLLKPSQVQDAFSVSVSEKTLTATDVYQVRSIRPIRLEELCVSKKA